MLRFLFFSIVHHLSDWITLDYEMWTLYVLLSPSLMTVCFVCIIFVHYNRIYNMLGFIILVVHKMYKEVRY